MLVRERMTANPVITHPDASFGDAAQTHKRRVADALGNIVLDSGGGGHDHPLMEWLGINSRGK